MDAHAQDLVANGELLLSILKALVQFTRSRALLEMLDFFGLCVLAE
jgi:hypothetical protein